jgi:3-deoxy-D-manno-octulosonate 8-phosphate phosphatase (KDO 8-P phosphatase)
MSGQTLAQLANGIKLLICDVDGVLTDGRIYFMPDPQDPTQPIEIKVFHARDGHGLKLLQQAGIQVAVISGRKAPMVEARLKGLGITNIVQGCEDKLAALKELLPTLGLEADQVAYIGDDTIDIEIMQAIRFPVAVKDAHPAVIRSALWTTHQNGGQGAVRELCDLLIKHNSGS